NNGGKGAGALQPFSPDIGTSTMYDVLAAILSLYYPKTITMISRQLPLIVTDDGYTRINAAQGRPVQSAVLFQSENPYNSTSMLAVVALYSIIFS
ncbi:unnamed protein product, partial [Adineta ricciae]